MSQKYLFVTLYLYLIFWYSDIIPKSDLEVIFIILNRAVSVRNDVRTTDKKDAIFKSVVQNVYSVEVLYYFI